MKRAKKLLWGLNGLLAVGIIVFAGRYLAFPRAANPLSDVDPNLVIASPPRPPGERPNEEALLTLANPLRPPAGPPPPPPFQAILKGALPALDVSQAVVFIQSIRSNAETVAQVGEEISVEFAGWRLSEVWKDRAAFTNRLGDRCELEVAPIEPSGHPIPPQSRLYSSESFKSRRIAFSDTREVWGMDQNEVDLVNRNALTLLDQDFQGAPYAGGGIRIESMKAGSIGAARGLKTGDIVREVNGQPIASIGDLRTLLSNPDFRRQTGCRLTLERAGKPFLIEYHPLPR